MIYFYCYKIRKRTPHIGCRLQPYPQAAADDIPLSALLNCLTYYFLQNVPQAVCSHLQALDPPTSMPSARHVQSSLCIHFFASQRMFTFNDGSFVLFVIISERFSSKLSQHVSLVLFAPAPPTLILSLVHP